MQRILLLLLLLAPGMAFSAGDIGRLFTTPAQRESLDHLRKITPRMDATTAAQLDESTAEALEPVLPSAISVEGYVKRSDGKKGTVWVNNMPIQENTTTNKLHVGNLRKGNQVQIRVQSMDKSLNLKAGQVYIPETNSISEINAHVENASEANEDTGTVGPNSAMTVPTQNPASEARGNTIETSKPFSQK